MTIYIAEKEERIIGKEIFSYLIVVLAESMDLVFCLSLEGKGLEGQF